LRAEVETIAPKQTPKPTQRRSAPRRATPPRTVAEYIARVPSLARNVLGKLRATIRSAVPKNATEVISYRIPAFRTKRILVWYAAFSDHCSLFPTAAIIEQFKTELKNFRTSKGTIHFPLDKPLPAALIKKIVRARVGAARN
jgi:uncharacterized protein YdhG (YjbR/CyaY superfamily)